MKRLAILGASGHGKVVADCAECADWNEIVFFDDAWPKIEVNGNWSVVGDTQSLLNTISQYDGVIVAIGHNETRLNKQLELTKYGACIVSVIHPDAVVSQYAKLGNGSVVMAGVIINADTKLGLACIVNTGATIDHDCILGDAVHISPGVNLAGAVLIGDNAWIGIGSNIRQLTEVGVNTIVGAGSVVVKNIDANSTVVGNPASLLNPEKIIINDSNTK